MIENAKIIGKGVDPAAYHRQEPGIKRGDPKFVMGRSELMSFAHCPHRWLGLEEKDSTDSTAWGALIDCLVLDPMRFDKSYAVAPAKYEIEAMKCPSCGGIADYSTSCRKCGEQRVKTTIEKEWNWQAAHCQEFRTREEKAGKTVIKGGLKESANAAVAALAKDAVILSVLESSAMQVMVVAEWADKETGVTIPLKGLIDLVPDAKHAKFGSALADLKTCADASGWARAVFAWNLHVQAAFYLDLYNAATGEKRDTFLHVLSENGPPYEVGRRMLDSEFIALGRDSYTNALRWYCRCVKENKWPGYDDSGRGEQIDGFTIVRPLAWMLDDGVPRQTAKTIDEAIERAGL